MQHAAAVMIVASLLPGVGCRESPSEQRRSPQVTQEAQKYVLPEDFTLDVVAERGTEGEIFIAGSTNLPEGLKLGTEILIGQRLAGQDFHMIVRNGHFRSAGFTKGKELYPPGSYKVRLLSYFNEIWQRPDVLSLIGKGGKNLRGKLFKQTDPDVVDSDKILEQVRIITFPPLNSESKAIHLVRTAILTVPDRGRSATDVQTNIDLFMTAPGVRPGKGWSARSVGPKTYEVIFDFLDGGKPAQAIWSVNLDTGRVKYVNTSAKAFSWTPKD